VVTADYDLIVIGSGPAGEKAAAQAAYFGKKVAVVERDDRLGGAPVNRGGIPAKTLRETALYMTGFGRSDLYGVEVSFGSDITLDRLRSRAAAESERAGATVRQNLDRHGIAVVRGSGRLEPGHTVAVTGADGTVTRLSGAVVLIATGSHPFHPPGIGFDDPDIDDSDSILTLDRIPGSIVVVGGGPVGCEYASIYGALGVQVALVDMADRLLPFLDAEISRSLAECFADSGIRVMLGSPPAAIERGPSGLKVTVGGEVLSPDKVLFVAGRKGNTDGIGLAEAGVRLDDRGRIRGRRVPHQRALGVCRRRRHRASGTRLGVRRAGSGGRLPRLRHPLQGVGRPAAAVWDLLDPGGGGRDVGAGRRRRHRLHGGDVPLADNR
jgi:NAD(P) transhydrogenase